MSREEKKKMKHRNKEKNREMTTGKTENIKEDKEKSSLTHDVGNGATGEDKTKRKR